MIKLKPNFQRGRNAIMMIWLVLLLDVLSFVSGYFQYNLLDTVANGGEISMEEANFNDLREQAIGILYMIVFIVSVITFIKWFRRAYFNLQLKHNNLSYKDIWAAGVWFVPVISLFRPYQMMKELFSETGCLLEKNGIPMNQRSAFRILGWWWAFWIISNILGQLIFRFGRNADTVNELMLMTVASMINHLIGIPLALLAIKVIKEYALFEPFIVEIDKEEESLIA